MLDLDRPQDRTTLARNSLLNAIAISNDGLQVAAASDKTVQVWNSDGTEVLKVDAENVLGLAFSPDRRYLAVVGPSQITAWYLNQTDLFSDVCSRLTRNPSPEEWQSITTSPYRKLCASLP